MWDSSGVDVGVYVRAFTGVVKGVVFCGRKLFGVSNVCMFRKMGRVE